MRLSTRMRYGSRAMVVLSSTYGIRPVSVREIAEGQRIPKKYLERIFSALEAAGLVEGRRGVGGGYMLTRHPAATKLVEVFRALEGSTAPVRCVDEPGYCSVRRDCVMRAVWSKMDGAITDVLSSVTLADLLRQNNCKRHHAKQKTGKAAG